MARLAKVLVQARQGALAKSWVMFCNEVWLSVCAQPEISRFIDNLSFVQNKNQEKRTPQDHPICLNEVCLKEKEREGDQQSALNTGRIGWDALTARQGARLQRTII